MQVSISIYTTPWHLWLLVTMYVPWNLSHCDELILPRNDRAMCACLLITNVLMLMLPTRSETERFGTYVIGCSIYPHPCGDSPCGGLDGTCCLQAYGGDGRSLKTSASQMYLAPARIC
jgi:hypothetical protein